ncbi:hypothetical protein PanWU01x14_147550 [Parasponia andersonii]|uniref:Uncharacterized protein n=1 Tax=Parasponia andersonii TaxID=3476 RepID=A0A2P5CJJ4_PARAD|nr:hypothetical protein PanWU01x14_147550 [Parasponia andersonii]
MDSRHRSLVSPILPVGRDVRASRWPSPVPLPVGNLLPGLLIAGFGGPKWTRLRLKASSLEAQSIVF